MEKKTIGKFISALRRANGMTQKELSEKLFVSDKTVSRWECDECTPDLSLIPVIAEIFGITTDELLRGERNSSEDKGFENEASQMKLKGKSQKQFKVLLHDRFVKYQKLTLVSIGIAVVGLIAALISNLGFSRGVLGFGLGCIFLVVSIIFQICAIADKLMPISEEDDKQIFEIRKTNTRITKLAVGVMIVFVGMIGFLLPLVLLSEGGDSGVSVKAWLVLGFLCAMVIVAIIYVVYVFWIREKLLGKELLLTDKKYLEWMLADKKLLKKMVTIALTIGLVLGILAGVIHNLDAHIFVKPVVFETIPEFQKYMLENRNTHFENGMDVVISEAVEIVKNEENINEGAAWSQALDREGNVLFSYAAGDFYYLIKSDAIDGVPIEVYLKSDRAQVNQIRKLVVAVLVAMIVIEFMVCIAVYIRKTLKIKCED